MRTDGNQGGPRVVADQGEEPGFYSERERKSSMGFKPTNDKHGWW